MSNGKTWFSYILWLIATGFSVCFFAYNTIDLSIKPGVFGSTTIVERSIYSVLCIVILCAVFYLVGLLYQKIAVSVISKWVERGIHIITLLLVIGSFVITRIQGALSVKYDSVTVMNLFETSKIGTVLDSMHVPLSVWDKLYGGLLSGVFLFLGNKVEAMLYLQMGLQTISLLLLFFIGVRLLKGFWVWVLSAVYAIAPLFICAVADMGKTNFCFFLILCFISLICLVYQLFFIKKKQSDDFSDTEHVRTGESKPVSWEMSRSEISKRDVAIMNAISTEAKEKEEKKKEEKKNSKPSDFKWWEHEAKMENKFVKQETNLNTTMTEGVTNPMTEDEQLDEEPVLIRVSDIVKDTNSSYNDGFELSNQAGENREDIIAVDKTAMIENVLPMPKKHVNRTLDYAFEPSAEQMCYDVEVSADDDYDYQE